MFAASISDSRQVLLSAVHCSAEDALLCGLCVCCLSCALHAVTSHVLCWSPCNKGSIMLCKTDRHCSQLCIAMLGDPAVRPECTCILSYAVHAELSASNCMS